MLAHARLASPHSSSCPLPSLPPTSLRRTSTSTRPSCRAGAPCRPPSAVRRGGAASLSAHVVALPCTCLTPCSRLPPASSQVPLAAPPPRSAARRAALPAPGDGAGPVRHVSHQPHRHLRLCPGARVLANGGGQSRGHSRLCVVVRPHLRPPHPARVSPRQQGRKAGATRACRAAAAGVPTLPPAPLHLSSSAGLCRH